MKDATKKFYEFANSVHGCGMCVTIYFVQDAAYKVQVVYDVQCDVGVKHADVAPTNVTFSVSCKLLEKKEHSFVKQGIGTFEEALGVAYAHYLENHNPSGVPKPKK